jgi:hypothetical protein
MTIGLRVEVEIDLAGHPLVVEFGKKGRDQTQAGIWVGEDAGDPVASSQFPVDACKAWSCAGARGGRWRSRRPLV